MPKYGGNKFSVTEVPPKWVKSRRRRKKKEKEKEEKKEKVGENNGQLRLTNFAFYFGLRQISAKDLLNCRTFLLFFIKPLLSVSTAEPLLSITQLWVRFGNGEQRFGQRDNKFGRKEKKV